MKDETQLQQRHGGGLDASANESALCSNVKGIQCTLNPVPFALSLAGGSDKGSFKQPSFIGLGDFVGASVRLGAATRTNVPLQTVERSVLTQGKVLVPEGTEIDVDDGFPSGSLIVGILVQPRGCYFAHGSEVGFVGCHT